jgi:hypothetical protein
MSALPTHPDGRRLASRAPFFVILNAGAGADDARERMAAVTAYWARPRTRSKCCR